MHNNDFLFLLGIPKQEQEISPCSCSGLSLPGKSHVLVRCSHTVTGLKTQFLFLKFLDLLWNSLVPFTLSTHKVVSNSSSLRLNCCWNHEWSPSEYLARRPP